MDSKQEQMFMCRTLYGHDLLGIEKLDMANRPGWVEFLFIFLKTKKILNLVESIKR